MSPENHTSPLGEFATEDAPPSVGLKRPGWQLWLAVVWFVAFQLYFYAQDLPNNAGVSRPTMWQAVPVLLLDLLAPQRDETAPPAGVEFLPQRIVPIGLAAFVLFGAWAWGHLSLRAIKPPLDERCAERTVLVFAIGLSELSLLTLFAGLAGFLERPFFIGVLCVGIVTEIVCRIRQRSQSKAVRRSLELHQLFTGRISYEVLLRFGCVMIMVPFLIAMVLGACLPSTDFDVKEYHLQGPKEFFQAGQIEFLPHNVYTSFPFLTEMLSLLGMVLTGDWYWGALTGKTVLMCFGPLTAVAIYAAAKRWASVEAGWIAATVYLTTPWTYRISTIAYAEGGLSFFAFLALVTAIAAGANQTRRGVFLAGLLAGSAMACKYTGLVSAVIPGGLIVLFGLSGRSANGSRGFQISLPTAGVFVLGTAVTIGPWLVKNIIETGNPVYPLGYSIFGGADWDAEANAKWTAAHSPDDYDITRIPYWMRDVSAVNDWLSPLLYGLAPLAFLCVGSRGTVRFLWGVVAYLFLTWWCFTHRLDRFWVPMIPMVALLAGMGATWRYHRVWSSVCGMGAVAAVLFNLVIVTSGASGNNTYLIDLNTSRRLTAEITAPGIEFLNRHLPPNSRVLCVGEAQVFDARFPVVYNTVFDRSIFERWCSEQQPPVTHLFVNWKEILRYRTSYGFTDFVTPEKFLELEVAGVLGKPVNCGMQDYDKLSPTEQGEIDSWGRKLLRTVDGKPTVITAEVYPVLPPPQPSENNGGNQPTGK